RVRLLNVLERAEARDAVDRNIAENLLSRMQIVNVARRNDRLAQLIPDLDHAPNGLLEFCTAGDEPFFHQVHVERDRLNLQDVVESRDFLRFLYRLVQHRLEELALLAARDDEQAFAQLHELGLRNRGNALEVFRMGERYQLENVLLA